MIEPTSLKITWQDLIDGVGQAIDERISRLKPFSDWMDTTSRGNPIVFTAKLLCRVARNILRMAYMVLKCVLYTLVHPIKAVKELKQNLTILVTEMQKPETRIRIGSGVIAASTTNFFITGNPLCFIGIGIGSFTLLSGLYSVERIDQKVLELMVDSLVTGGVIGLTFGALWEVHLDRTDLTDPTAIPEATTNETYNQGNTQLVTVAGVKK